MIRCIWNACSNLQLSGTVILGMRPAAYSNLVPRPLANRYEVRCFNETMELYGYVIICT